MHILCCLHFFRATHQISIEARHVPSTHNIAADALSCNKMKVFSSTPQAWTEATRIAAPLLDMLLHQHPDWVSPDWRRMLLPWTGISSEVIQVRADRFCQEAGLQSLPLSEQVLCMFVTHLYAEFLAYQTLKCYHLAIYHYSIMAGQGDPFGLEHFHDCSTCVFRGVA